MKIETRDVADLKLDSTNARLHDQINLDAIAGSLEKFGQQKPIVITSAGRVLAGNGTLLAARSLNWETIEVVIAPSTWDKQTAKAYALADNRTSELASWNENVLATQLLELKETGFDTAAIGFPETAPADYEIKDLDEFPSFDDKEPTSHQCPKCGYEWNGKTN